MYVCVSVKTSVYIYNREMKMENNSVPHSVPVLCTVCAELYTNYTNNPRG